MLRSHLARALATLLLLWAALAPAHAQRIACIDAREGHRGVIVVNADGSGLVRLTSDPYDMSPQWTPDGRRIAFTSVRTTANLEDLAQQGAVYTQWLYFVMDADGKNVRPLLTTPAYQLRWSPDGKRFAFQAGHEDPANQSPAMGVHSSAIYVVDDPGAELAGKTARRITPVEGHDGPFSWSPDGRRLLYMSNRTSGRHGEGNWDVCVVSADGGAVTNLTGEPAQDTDPIWCADGERVVFRSDRGGAAHLWVLDTRGGPPRQLPRTSPFDTPLFCTPAEEVVYAAADEVWAMSLDGTGQRKLATVDTGFGTLRDGDVDLSPDGETLAYVSRAGLFTVPVAGGRPTLVLAGNGYLQLAYAPR